ncbi:tyrosine-protein kinase Etk/Wzc [Catalinimonas alkaloidigena]|uniref:GumC family protein n=1 Tax=Catalinimonas alkaloidigena TaxID=1075417 RepID=UPI002405EA2E|nr:polysaccharide biosynthesis tyrosine autokinase [Catalinimonas alkaloidigena]MDF9799695.1 tyrosine-protein kinase Etk/Wzc [Catalinimonas alkaloidigena]
MKTYQPPHQQDMHSLNVKDVFRKIFRYWYYFLITAGICGVFAVVYLKFTVPVYLMSTSLLVQDEDGISGTEMIMQDIYPQAGNKNLENEIGLIQSHTIINETLKSLDFEVSYFKKEFFGNRELYHSAPFWLTVDTTTYQLRGVPMRIQPLTQKQYKVQVDAVEHEQVCDFGEACQSEFFSFKAYKGFKKLPDENDVYSIVINDLTKITDAYRKNLVIKRLGSESTLLELSVFGSLPKKEINFLNKLSEVYTKRNLQEKNQTASLTIDFINSQLSDVSDSLKGAENQLESFKTQENVMDISLTAANASTKLSSLETDQADLNIKLKYYNYLLKYLQDSTDINSVVAPSSVGIADPLLNELIIELKRLHKERVAINYTRTAKSNELELLNLQIANARSTIIENVTNIIESTRIALQEVNNRLAEVRRVVEKLPENEKDLMRIQRKFNLSDNLYNFLLQKRAEAGIAKASNLPDHKMVDQARIVGGEPVSPRKSLVYILAAVLTLILPTLFILVKTSLTDTITDLEQIEKLTSIPIAGKIVHVKSGNTISNVPNSILAESFRTLRVNLQYFSLSGEPKVIGVTSTVSGEGKTFCAYNLASILALAKKKVILLETDLRKPRLIHHNKKLSYRYGLSNYLVGRMDWKELVQPTYIEDLQMISSGPIPPNPVELLESGNLKKLIYELRQYYDFVVIDTPPTGLVTDYVTIMNNVDVTLYVVRLDYSKTYFLTNLDKDFHQGKYKNFSLVINDVKKHNSYGYGYAYGYGHYYNQNGKSKKSDKYQKLNS